MEKSDELIQTHRKKYKMNTMIMLKKEKPQKTE